MREQRRVESRETMALEQQVQQLSDMVLQLQQNQARLEQENQVLRESQGGGINVGFSSRRTG